MRIIDLNILLYAVNRDAPVHERVRKWWEGAVNSDDPVGLPWVVVLGFLRLSTSPSVFPSPLTLPDAVARVDAWLSHPNVRVVVPGESHWLVLKGLLGEVGTGGNLTTDAHLAALAIEHGAVLASCDADFARYPHLRRETPLG
jgi:hypothetical protein